MEHRGQGVKIGTIYPEPVEIIPDSLNGNEIVFWQIQQPAEGQQLYFYYDFEVFPEEVNTNVDPMKIAPYETESAQYLRYTISEPWIEITPEIEETAAEIVGAEKNSYFQARKIFHWVVDNMHYEYPDTSQRGVAKSFPKRKGDCGEYAWAFCALCRSVGIPARSITCRWINIEGGHAWAEFLLPPYGWIPVDPSIADGLIEGAGGASREEFFCWARDVQKISSTDPNYFFGNLYPNRLIVCIGNNVPVLSHKTGIQRTFKFMQPGGSSALPPAIEFDGLAHKAVHGGFFLFGSQRTNLAQAQARAEQELAFSYFMAQLYDQAEKGFSKKLAEQPEDAASLWGLGMVYMLKKDYDAAINTFHRSIACGGGSSKPAIEALARYKLGNCYDVKGMRSQAVREYQTVVRMDVNFYGAVDSSKRYLQKAYVEPEEE